MESALFTESAFLVSKNSVKGHNNETVVADYLESKGWEVILRNQRLFGVEIDLIAKKKTSYILVEVKSLNSEFYLEKIISLKQKQRLKKVHSLLCQNFTDTWFLYLVTVTPTKEIMFFSLTD